MTDPNIQRLTSTIAKLQQEWQFERETRRDLTKHNYALSNENKRLREALEDIVSTNDLGLNDYDIVEGVMSTAKEALEETK